MFSVVHTLILAFDWLHYDTSLIYELTHLGRPALSLFPLQYPDLDVQDRYLFG